MGTVIPGGGGPAGKLPDLDRVDMLLRSSPKRVRTSTNYHVGLRYQTGVAAQNSANFQVDLTDASPAGEMRVAKLDAASVSLWDFSR